MIIGNGGLPIVESTAELPDNIEASSAAFDELIRMIPDEQPSFLDADGSSLLPAGDGEGDAFGDWAGCALEYDDFQVSTMMEALTIDAFSPGVEAAYDAPFPARIAMAGPRTFPSLRNELFDITREPKENLTMYESPFLTIFGGNDTGLVGEGDDQAWMIENIPGAAGQPHERIADASHFLQDGKGPEIAAMVNDLIAATS